MDINEATLAICQVVTQDQILSKNGKWYEVAETTNLDTGETRFRLVGVAKPFVWSSDREVQTIRSPMGKAVDIFVEIMSSGAA